MKSYIKTSASYNIEIAISTADRLSHEGGGAILANGGAILVAPAITHSFTIPAGAIITFDDTQANGSAIESALQSAGFTQV